MLSVFNKFRHNGIEFDFNFTPAMVRYITEFYGKAIFQYEDADTSGFYDYSSRIVPPDSISIDEYTIQGRHQTIWNISPHMTVSGYTNAEITNFLKIIENKPPFFGMSKYFYDDFVADYIDQGSLETKEKAAYLFTQNEINEYNFTKWNSHVSIQSQPRQYVVGQVDPDESPYTNWPLQTVVDKNGKYRTIIKMHIDKDVSLQYRGDLHNMLPEDIPNSQYWKYYNTVTFDFPNTIYLALGNITGCAICFDDVRSCYVLCNYTVWNTSIEFQYSLFPSLNYRGFGRYVKGLNSTDFVYYFDDTAKQVNDWLLNSFSEPLTVESGYRTIPSLVSPNMITKLSTITKSKISDPNDGVANITEEIIQSLSGEQFVFTDYSIQENFDTKEDGSTTTLECGNNKVDIIKTSQGESGYILTFNFYFGNENSPFYSHDLGVGTMPCYLSFIYNPNTNEGFLNPIYLMDSWETETTIHKEYRYNTISFTNTEKTDLYNWLKEIDELNPYDTSTTDLPSGGINFHKRATEDIIPGAFPTKTGLGLNLFTAYRMTSSQLSALGAELWNPSIWNDLKDFYQSPVDMIMGLYLLPFTGDYFEEIPENIKAGNKSLSGAVGHRINSRYVTLDLGQLKIEPKWDTFLDYKPTEITVHLPFIGEFNLDSNDVMNTIENVNGDGVITNTGSVLHLYYKVDVLTGTIVAQIFVNGSMHYEFIGSCSSELPYSWSTRNTAIQGVLGGISGFVSNLPGAIGGSLSAIGNILAGSFAAGMASGTSEVHINGSLSGLPGALACNYPYVSFSVPKIVMAKDQPDYTGLPTLLTSKIGKYYDVNGMEKDFKGFIKVMDIHLDNFTGTAEEKAEIERLLKEGVLV